MLKWILALVLITEAKIAESYPEMGRLGYASCSTCHVSPTGGGALNGYGRMISREELATFGSGETKELPNWLKIGGDTRYTNVTYEAYNFKGHKHFLMQSDIEVAVSPVPGLTVAGTVGVYDVEHPNKRKTEFEQRRNYVLVDISENFSFRAGSYYAPYGIHFADHTISSRKFLGYGPGEETFNFEGSAKNSMGEIFLAGINGKSGKLEANGKKGYQWNSPEQEFGYSGRVSWFFGEASQAGLSFKRVINPLQVKVKTNFGVFAMLSFTRHLYTLFEMDRILVTGEKPQFVWVTRQGLELYKGIHLNATYEGVSSNFSAWRWALLLFPYPHFDVSAEYQRKVSQLGVKTEAWVFVVHTYL